MATEKWEDVIYPRWFFDADDVSAIFLPRRSGSWSGESGLTGKNETQT
ncbi:MAG: hypothetical protein JXR86_08285 [Spirochaetales bacterium]|nr:hypothetical protein [Spirochaetales bacterium]